LGSVRDGLGDPADEWALSRRCSSKTTLLRTNRDICRFDSRRISDTLDSMSNTHSASAETHEVTIFHNPSCSHSRGALGILDEQSIDYGVIEYLVTPPSRQTLEMIVSKLIDPIPELIRTKDKKFVELDLDPHGYTSSEEVIELLLVHPELMQRPVVIKGDRAVIARPSERVAEVLA
jgi:arsenate reductase (glutaredoxin)